MPGTIIFTEDTAVNPTKSLVREDRQEWMNKGVNEWNDK